MLFAVAFLVLLAPSVLGDAFTGCISSFSTPSGAVTMSTAKTNADCITACESSTYKYSYFYTSQGTCKCSNTGPPSGSITSGTQTSCNGYISMMVGSSYTNYGSTCYTASTMKYDARDTGSPTWSLTLFADCINQCRYFTYNAVTASGSSSTPYTCRCFNYPITGGTATTCAASTTFVFGHSPEAAASGIARRSREQAKIQQKLSAAANAHCPKGYDACNISLTPEDGYECLKSASELESCGGCRYGAYGYDYDTSSRGVDCTTLPGVIRTAVTCSDGQCIASQCKHGFRLRGGRCLRW